MAGPASNRESCGARTAHRARGRPAAKLRAASLCLIACGCIGSLQGQEVAGIRTFESTEVAPFRLTGIDGYVRTGYWRDGTETVTEIAGSNPTDTLRTRLTTSDLRGEIFLMTHSYIYHPNFLLLDLGAGPVFDRNTYSVDGVATAARDTTYNLTGRAKFLRDKPFRGGLFFERKNDNQPVGPAQSLLTENTRYGFDMALLAPATPMPLRLDANRFKSQGKGTDQVIDSRVDDINFRTERAYRGIGESRFSYHWVADESKSGSLGLPIQSTRSRTQRVELDTDLNLGARKQYDLTHGISFIDLSTASDRGTLFETQQFRFSLDFRGRHSDTLQTRARYQFDHSDQQAESASQTSRLNYASAGATYQPTPELTGTLDANAAFSRTSAFSSDQPGVNGSISYRHALPLGEVAASYGFGYFWRDQTALEPIARVLGERVTLSGTTFVKLRSPLVVASTVVVSNVSRTQTFIAGLDYALRVVGLDTQIQRLVGGNILDGQDVLIDYDYDTGGTYALSQFDNTVNLSWGIREYFNLYVRYFDSSPHLRSGVPSTPLNPARTLTYGARADVPFSLLSEQLRLGGSAEREVRHEVISPYTRTTFEAYAESTLPLIARGGIRYGAMKQRTNYELRPDLDADVRSYTLRLWSRIRGGIDLSIDANRTRDSGTPERARDYDSVIARVRWRVRRLLMTAELNRTHEAQNRSERTHTRGQFEVRRDF